MRRIQSRAELRLEIERLKVQQHLHEVQIHERIRSITEKLKPINLIKSSLSSFSSDSDMKNQFTSKGIEAILGFVVSNLLFRKSNVIIRTVASILGSSLVLKFFGEDSGKYLEKIQSLYMKVKGMMKKDDKDDSVFNEGDIYRG